MSKHLDESNLSYSEYVQGLMTSGLMYQSVINNGGDQKYSFTPLALTVKEYALSCQSEEDGPDSMQVVLDAGVPQIELCGALKWEEITGVTSEQLDTLF